MFSRQEVQNSEIDCVDWIHDNLSKIIIYQEDLVSYIFSTQRTSHEGFSYLWQASANKILATAKMTSFNQMKYFQLESKKSLSDLEEKNKHIHETKELYKNMVDELGWHKSSSKEEESKI